MRFFHRILPQLFILAWTIPACAAALSAPKNSSIAIEKAVPTRLEQRFKMGEQPEHLSYKLQSEAGLCVYQYGCQILVETEYPRLALKKVTATVRGIKLRLSLETTLWVSKEGGAKVQAHEEAHRAICEHFYRDADEIAASLARKLIGQKITVPNKERDRAFQVELEKLQQRFLDDYAKAVNERCAFAQTRFDEITDHGRAPVPADEAIEQALADERARSHE